MLKRIRRPARPTVETKLGSLEDARNGMLNLAFCDDAPISPPLYLKFARELSVSSDRFKENIKLITCCFYDFPMILLKYY